MNKVLRVCLFVFPLSLAWCSQPLWGQDFSSLQFRHFNQEQGLSNNYVHAIVQDPQGFIWVGTSDGLNRYDGIRNEVYRYHSQDNRSLAANYVLSLLVDSAGRLWVGTRGGGLSLYVPEFDGFRNWHHDSSNPNSLSADYVTALAEGPDGEIWVGTRTAGLNRFDPETGIFTVYTYDEEDPLSIGSKVVGSLFVDRRNRLWVGTGASVDMWEPDQNRFRHFILSDKDPSLHAAGLIKFLFEDQEGVLWAGSQSLGVFIKPSHRENFAQWEKNRDEGEVIIRGAYDIVGDGSDRLWIATAKGIQIYHRGQDRLFKSQHDPTNSSSLAHNMVRSLFKDRNGLIWVGTRQGGLDLYNPDTSRFRVVQHDSNDPNSLNNNAIWSINKQKSGMLWVGTFRSGLNRYDPQNQEWIAYQHDPDQINSLSNNSVFTLLTDVRDDLWVGTSHGLNRYQGETDSFRVYQSNAEDPRSLSNSTIYSMIEGQDGTLWIGTNHGLNTYNPHTDGFRQPLEELSSHSEEGKNPTFFALAEENDGTLWAGTFQNGLWRINFKTGEIKEFKHDSRDSSSLGSDEVTCVFVDSMGGLWVGGRTGLAHFDRQSETFEHLHEIDGLSNNTVFSIFEDQQQRLWMSTNFGITRYDLVTGLFKTYFASDGLPGNEFNFASSFQNADGELFFGGNQGLAAFYPGQIEDDDHPPGVVITDFLLFNRSVPVAEPDRENLSSPQEAEEFSLSQSIQTTKQLTLDHSQNVYTFVFSALNFKDPHRNGYRYILDGWDEDWIDTDANQPSATYTNIPHGDYTFRVKAHNKDGLWSSGDTHISLTIQPPFWRTPWAYGTYVLALLSLILWFVQSQRKKVADERRINQRLRRVDKLKDEFLANTSHELRTPLHGINGIVESLIDGIAGTLPETALKNLRMILSSGRRLNMLVDDILDFSKLKTKDLNLHHQPTDIFSTTNVVVALSSVLVGAKRIKLINDVPRDLPLVSADEGRLQQILHNLISNAIKFTEAGSVSIHASHQEAQVEVSVSDTGCGIPEEKLDLIFESFEQGDDTLTRSYGGTGLGLAISRKLIELHGGELKVRSEVGSGSTFFFTLPIADEIEVQERFRRQSALVDEPKIEIEPVSLKKPVPSGDPDGFQILVVDDDPVNRQVLNNYLSFGDYSIVQAENGFDALRAIENHDYDLVLLDIMMPGISGYEVCKKIRNVQPL